MKRSRTRRPRVDRTTYRLDKIEYELDRLAQEQATLPAETFKSRLLALKGRIEEMIDESENPQDRHDK